MKDAKWNPDNIRVDPELGDDERTFISFLLASILDKRPQKITVDVLTSVQAESHRTRFL